MTFLLSAESSEGVVGETAVSSSELSSNSSLVHVLRTATNISVTMRKEFTDLLLECQ